jgi:hypothetical protein
VADTVRHANAERSTAVILPVVHRLEIVQGAAPGQLLGVPKLFTHDGTEIDAGESVPLKVGQCVTFGPIKLEVNHEATFGSGATPQDTNANQNAAGKQPAIQQRK